jgi:hypothetical protein
MGFKKPTIAQSLVTVPMSVPTFSDDPADRVDVAHVFTIPSAKVREEYQRQLVKIKGRKVQGGNTSDASWYLWIHCVDHVIGYDDLPEGENWKEYFNDAIGRIHVDNAVTRLMDYLTGDEVDSEKKSEPSSVS